VCCRCDARNVGYCFSSSAADSAAVCVPCNAKPRPVCMLFAADARPTPWSCRWRHLASTGVWVDNCVFWDLCYLTFVLHSVFGRIVKVSRVNCRFIIVHRRKHASNALPLPVSWRWSPLARSFSQAFIEHCKTTDTGWCIRRYACLLPQLLPGTHSSLTTEGGLRLSRFCAEVVYPSKDGHPSRH